MSYNPTIKFYDQDGNEITSEQWRVLIETEGVRRVKRSTVGALTVSTLFVGTEFASPSEIDFPRIYETMVVNEVDMVAVTDEPIYDRNLKDAKATHARLVRELRADRKSLKAASA